jgi:hypothetical protein
LCYSRVGFIKDYHIKDTFSIVDFFGNQRIYIKTAGGTMFENLISQIPLFDNRKSNENIKRLAKEVQRKEYAVNNE